MKRLVIGRPHFEGVGELSAKLNKLILENNRITGEYGSVGNNTGLASIGYNPFQSDDNNKVMTMPMYHYTFEDQGDDGGQDVDTSEADKANNSNYQENMKNKVAGITRYIKKADGFQKSSVAKIKEMNDNKKNEILNDMIEKTKENPVTISDYIMKGIKGAGLAVGAYGLATVSLPLAVGAALVGGKIYKDKRKNAADKIKNDMVIIDSEIKKAEAENNIDRQADLMILKRTSQQAYNKLKWGINIDPDKMNQ